MNGAAFLAFLALIGVLMLAPYWLGDSEPAAEPEPDELDWAWPTWEESR